jgi:hypothetical protein
MLSGSRDHGNKRRCEENGCTQKEALRHGGVGLQAVEQVRYDASDHVEACSRLILRKRMRRRWNSVL